MNACAIARAALQYLTYGWSVIPVRPADKRPSLRWQAYQEQLPTPEEIARWYRRWPHDNVGIVTGRLSGLVVVDVDPKHGGEESLRRLEQEYGPLPRTVEAGTGGGGRHLYFAHPGGIVRNRVALAPGIDVRGDGGYVVAPPSRHSSGRYYLWVAGRDPAALDPAPLPAWLAEGEAESAARHGHPLRHWRALVKEGVEEGARNNTLASFAGHLLWHGVDPEVVLELLLAWNTSRCRPPLPADEVAQVVDSITRLHVQEQERRERDRGRTADGEPGTQS